VLLHHPGAADARASGGRQKQDEPGSARVLVEELLPVLRERPRFRGLFNTWLGTIPGRGGRCQGEAEPQADEGNGSSHGVALQHVVLMMRVRQRPFVSKIFDPGKDWATGLGYSLGAREILNPFSPFGRLSGILLEV
jgi:hypothetical protein